MDLSEQLAKLVKAIKADIVALRLPFTSAVKGLTPASGGGTTNFLRADGTWAAPAGGGGGGTGTVTSVSVLSANGLAGSVATPTVTPAITLSVTFTGLAKAASGALAAATAGSDYSAGTAGLATGIVKSTTGTGALTVAVAGDFPTLNQNTTGTAASVTGTNVVANTHLAQMPATTFKANASAGIANVGDITGTQATALLDAFTPALKGLTPASGGGSTNFLRADGTWAAPAGGGGSATATQVTLNVASLAPGCAEVVVADALVSATSKLFASLVGELDAENDVEELADTAMRVFPIPEAAQIRFVLTGNSRFAGPFKVNYERFA